MTDRNLNLLFIFTDQQRADTMAAYGNLMIKVPNLNRLSSEGIVFERAYVTQPVCTPSRASIMTGLYPHTTGCTSNNIQLSIELKTLPELADFDEYRKGYIGKWHLGDEIFCQHGFDEWISVEDHYRRYYSRGRDRTAHCSYYHWLIKKGFEPTDTTQDGFKFFSRPVTACLPEEFCKPEFEAQEASRFIWENHDNPFVLYINFLEPHPPAFGPRDNQYALENVALPENFNILAKEDQPLKARMHKFKLRKLFARTDKAGLERVIFHTTHYLRPTEDDFRRHIASYWGLVSQVDTAIGKILHTIRKCGLEKNTIILFTSDHGDMMGSHHLPPGKGLQFEEAVRVPLIVRIPGYKAGQIIREPVSQVDLVPTLLDLMGKAVPQGLEGYSWKPWLDGTGEREEQDVFIEWSPQNGGKGNVVDHPIRTIVSREGWKLNLSTFGQHELYNLNEDYLESTNLVHQKEHRTLIRRLYKRIRAWQIRTRDSIKLPPPS